METILVTGGAGFIGSNLADTLLDKGYHVIAVDNFDDFYEPAIKRSNISRALARPGYTFIESDVCNTDFLLKVLPAGIFALYIWQLKPVCEIQYYILQDMKRITPVV